MSEVWGPAFCAAGGGVVSLFGPSAAASFFFSPTTISCPSSSWSWTRRPAPIKKSLTLAAAVGLSTITRTSSAPFASASFVIAAGSGPDLPNAFTVTIESILLRL